MNNYNDSLRSLKVNNEKKHVIQATQLKYYILQ